MVINPYAFGYRAKAVVFDGTNDWLSRSSAISGISDGKQGLLSLWFKLNGGDGARQTFFGISSIAGSTSRFGVQRETTNKIRIFGTTGGGSLVLDMASTTSYTAGSTWRHLLASWNLATPATHLYITDVNDEAGGTTEVDNTISYTSANVGIGASQNGTAERVNADIADLYFTDTYLDLSSVSNRAKFISGGKPVFLGSNGSVPTGVQPKVFFSGDATSWATNLGTGGTFTVNGALADAATSPSD